MLNSTNKQRTGQSASVQTESTRVTSNQIPSLKIYLHQAEFAKIITLMDKTTVEVLVTCIIQLRLPIENRGSKLVIAREHHNPLTLAIINALLMKEHNVGITYECDANAMCSVSNQERIKLHPEVGAKFYRHTDTPRTELYYLLEETIEPLYILYIDKYFADKDAMANILPRAPIITKLSSNTDTEGNLLALSSTSSSGETRKAKRNARVRKSRKLQEPDERNNLSQKQLDEQEYQVQMGQGITIQDLQQEALRLAQQRQAQEQEALRLAQQRQAQEQEALHLAQQRQAQEQEALRQEQEAVRLFQANLWITQIFQVLNQAINLNLAQRVQAGQQCQVLEQNTQNLAQVSQFLTAENAQLLGLLNTGKQPSTQPGLHEQLLAKAATVSTPNLLGSLYRMFPEKPVENASRLPLPTKPHAWDGYLGLNQS